MKAVLQRVTRASVQVNRETVGQIGPGLLVLLGVAKGDDDRDTRFMADKLTGLRIFPDEQGKMNRSLLDCGGEALIISQFTLLGDTAKGRRPGFDKAEGPERARRLYDQVILQVRALGVQVQTGIFGAEMQVELTNDGPVTFILDSRAEVPGGRPRL